MFNVMAKKAKSTLINMLLSMTVIALVAAAALAVMNSVTEKPIQDAKDKKVQKAISDVLKQVDATGKTVDSLTYKKPEGHRGVCRREK